MMSRLARYRVGILTVGLLTAEWLAIRNVEFDPQQPGLGNTTQIYDAAIAGHAARDNSRPIAEVLSVLPERADGVVPIVWLGNSHQHAINNYQPGQDLASVKLHRL